MILNIAAERGMTDLIITTCKIMGMKALRENDRIGTAVAWALKSQVIILSLSCPMQTSPSASFQCSSPRPL